MTSATLVFSLLLTGYLCTYGKVSDYSFFVYHGGGLFLISSASPAFAQETATPTITTVDDPTNLEIVPFIVTYDQDVFGFELENIVVSGTANDNKPEPIDLKTIDARTYTFDVARGSSDGTITVFIPSFVSTDPDGKNLSTNSGGPITITIDTVPLTVSVATTADSLTNVDTIPFTVTFNKDVEGFIREDITVTGTANGGILAASNFETVDARTYTFNVAGISSDGTVIVSIAADVATDDAGNSNTASAPVTVTIDPIPLTVSVATTADSLTNVDTIPFTVTFNKDVEGFIREDITVAGSANGGILAASNFETVDARTYTFNVAGISSDGTVIVSIAADVATDSAGNPNTASAPVTVTIDTVPLTVSVSTTVGEDTNLATIPFTATFNKDVEDFIREDITVTGSANGGILAASDFETVDARTYTFNVAGISSDGTVTASIAADLATDSAGNSNIASAPVTVTIDTVPLTVSVSTTADSLTNVDTIPFTATFNKDVEDFDLRDITVAGTANNGNPVASNLLGTGSVYTFDVVRGSSDGTIIVSIAADVATDVAGNRNGASPSPVTVTIDTVPLTVSVSTTVGEDTNLVTIPFTATFNKAVEDFELSDITVTGTANGGTPTAANFQTVNARTYTFDVARGTTDGTVTASIAADVAADLAGNLNTASNSVTIEIDTERPRPLLLGPPGITSDTATLTVEFSEAVPGFSESEFTLDGLPPFDGLTPSNIRGSGLTYTFDITHAETTGILNVSIPANVISDAAGNGNTRSTETFIPIDLIRPTSTITTTLTSPVNTDTVPFTVTFSEDVGEFVLADITVTGTANGGTPVASNLDGTGDVYTFDVARGSTDGTVTVSIAADVTTDLLGNLNEASDPVTVTIDTLAPTVSVSSSEGDNTGLDTVPFTVTFSEDVGEFVLADITVTGTANGGAPAAANFQTVNARTYTFDVARGSTDGTVIISIDAEVAADSAGNLNEASAPDTVTIDTVPLTVSVSTTADSLTNVDTIPFTATFNKDVEDFDLRDITVAGTANNGNPVASNLLGTGSVYTFDVVRGSSDGTIIVSIAADVATDVAGNRNGASPSPVTVTIDTVPLTVSVSTTVGEDTNLATIPFTATFNKAVEDFELSDITITGTANNGTLAASDFETVDARTYTFNVAGISSDGTVTASIAADLATDDAGNSNTASAPVTVNIDIVPLTVSVSTTVGEDTNLATIPFTATFNKDVEDFDLRDITVAGTANNGNPVASNLLGTGSVYTFDVVRGSSDGTIIVSIAADVATDVAGNRNGASPSPVTVTIDTVPLTVSVSTTVGEDTNLATIPFTATFNKDVEDFIREDVTITGTANNGTLAASDFETVDARTYTFNVAGISSDGTVTASIAADLATDSAGNSNTASAPVTVTIDTVPLTVSVSTTVGEDTNLATIPFTATFNKDVEDFDLRDITVAGTANNGNPMASNLLGTGSVYTFDVVRGSSDGTIIVSIAADVATDVAGNRNGASPSPVTVTIDTVPLTVSVSTTVGEDTNLATIPFTATFNKDVEDFIREDITVTGTANGGILAASDFETVDARTYTFNVAGISSDGTVTASIAADLATDIAGNSNTASAPVTVTIDTVPLTVSVSTTIGEDTNLATIPFTATFNKDVEDFDLRDITVAGTANNGNPVASNLLGTGSVYTFDVVRGSSDGTIIVSIAADVATDVAGNRNGASPSPVTVTIDTVPLTVSVSTTVGEDTNLATIPFTATFNKDVEDFIREDITITGTANNGTLAASDFETVDARTYTFNVAGISSDGTVTASIAADLATDIAGNSNTASAPVTVTIDTVPLTVSVSTTVGEDTNLATIPFTATFNKDVEDFDLRDITVAGTANNGNPVASNLLGTGSVYTFDVVRGSSDGTIIVSIAADLATDDAGNSNIASAPVTVTIDTVPLTVSVSTTADSLTNVDTIPFTATFNKDVEDFDLRDITVAGTANNGNPVASNLLGTGSVYTFDVVRGSSDGTILVSITADVATDVAGNRNGASPSPVTVTIDTVPLTVSVSTTVGEDTNLATIPFTATFNKDVEDFIREDLTITGTANGGTLAASDFETVDARTYTFNVAGISSDGTVTASIAAGVTTDSAGNSNTASAPVTVTIDTVPLTVSVSTTVGEDTNLATLPFTATFNKDVEDFDLRDITVAGTANNGNPVASNLLGTGSVYTFDVVRGSSDGTILVSIAADVATDVAGNRNGASLSPVTVTIDTVPLTVSVSTTVGEYTNLATIPFTATFNKDVEDFIREDLTITGTANGGTLAASDFETVDARTYTFNVAGISSDGTVTASIAADLATDIAGNSNTASAPVTVTIDTVPLTVSVSTTVGEDTNLATIPFTATFNKDVEDFELSDITITGTANGGTLAASDFETVDARTYTFNVAGISSDGTVTASIAAGVTTDSAGNSNTASAPVTVTIDTVPLTVSVATTADSLTNVDTIPFTATFNKDVEDFDLRDITVAGTANNGNPMASNLLGTGSVYTFDVVRGSSDGTIIVSIAADVATDVAGNRNGASLSPVTVTIDTVPLTVSVSTTVGEDTNLATIPFTATFNKDVEDFELSDITITGTANGGTLAASDFETVDARTYTFNVAGISSDGTVTASIAAGVTTDSAGNSNTVSAPVTVTIDTVPLTVSVSTTVGEDTNLATIPFTATFNKAVEDFELSDITITGTANGGTLAASDFETVDARTYTFNVAGISSVGTVTASIAAGVTTDSAGNSNIASAPVTVTIDTVPLTVSVSTTADSLTNVDTIPFTATFNKDVEDFDLRDITVTGTANNGNPVASNLLGTGSVYTFDVVRGSSDGTIIVSIAADVATDVAGNRNGASPSPVTVTIDTVPLTVSVSTTVGEDTNLATIQFTATFNKAVEDFIREDITITGTANGGTLAASDFETVDARTYTFNVAGISSDGTVTASIAADLATDIAGNSNTASAPVTVTIDTVPLTVSVSTTVGEDTNLATIPFTATFNKAVEDFIREDITITGTANGGTLAASDFETVDARTYTFNVAGISSDGTVTASIAADLATDDAGNSNTASAPVTVTVDTFDPTVSITPLDGTITGDDPVTFTVEFSENVQNFELGDVTITGTANGSAPAADNFVTIDARTYTFDVVRGSSDGTVIVSIAADVATDDAGNRNEASAPVTVTIISNTLPPVPTVAPVITLEHPVLVSFQEFSLDGHFTDPEGDTLSYINPEDGCAGTLTQQQPPPTGSDTFRFVSSTAETCTLSFDISDGTGASTGAAYTVSISVVLDAAPVRTATPLTVDVLSSQPRKVTLDINNYYTDTQTLTLVSDPTSSDCTDFVSTILSNGQFDFEPINAFAGASTCTVQATFSDGNRHTTADLTINYLDAATVSLDTDVTDPTNSETIQFTATFGSDVTGFIADDIVVTIDGNPATPGSLITEFAGSGADYTFTVTHGIAAEGQLTVTIPANAVVEDNTASTTSTLTVDRINPSVTITPADGTTTGDDPVTFTATFSEDVQNFELGDITVTGTANGGAPAADNLQAVNAHTYTFDVTRGSSDGTVTMSIGTGALTDLAGNLNEASAPVTVTIDTIPLTVSVSTTVGDNTNLATIPFTATFNKNVDFELGDITVTGTANDGNPAASNLLGTGSVYTFDVARGSSDGTINVSIGAGALTDSAGNPNTTSNLVTVIIDTLVPTVSVISSTGSSTGLDTVPFRVTFSEDVEEFVLTDITVTGTANDGILAASDFVTADARTYTFNVAGISSDGTVIVSIAAGVAADLANNPNTASAPVTVTIDTTVPSVSLDTTVADPTNSEAIEFTATFSEDVTGFVQSDILVAIDGIPASNSLITAFDEISGTQYDFTVTHGITTDGELTVTIPDNAVEGGNTASTHTLTVDRIGPSVTITPADGTATGDDPVTFTATFNEDVQNFELGDITVTGTANDGNPAASNLLGTGSVYTFDVARGSSDGTINVSIGAGALTDSAGNPNTTSNLVTVIIDTIAPTVSVTSNAGENTNSDTVTFTATFSEDVEEIISDNITVTGTANGGTLAATNVQTVNARTYTFDVVGISTDGTIIASIGADVTTDLAGNPNEASISPVTVTVDTIPLTVSVSTTVGDNTNLATIPFTATFNKNVDFELGDITVTGTANDGNPAASNLLGTGSVYTFDVTRGSSDGTINVSIGAGAITDSAGNPNTASNLVTVIIDTLVPTVSVISSTGSSTGLDTVPFTVEFSEDVRNFELGDITVTGTANDGILTASDFVTADARTYTFNVAGISTDGTVIVSIAAGVAADLANNPNTASAPVTVTIDTTVPSVSLDTTVADPTNSEAIEFTATFDEDVTGFVQSDILVAIDGIPASNSLITAFDEISGTQYDFTVTHGIATDGELTVTIPDNAVEGGNTASAITLTVDRTNPSVFITPVDGTTTSDDPVTFTAIFTEDVREFILTDITVTGTANGGAPAANNLQAVNPHTYAFEVARGSSDGTVTVSIGAGALTDLAGNLNTASAPVTVTIDTTVPNSLPPVPAQRPVITLEHPTLAPPTFSLDDHFTDPDDDTLLYTITEEDCDARITQESNGGIFEFLPFFAHTCTISFDISDGTDASTGGAYAVNIIVEEDPSPTVRNNLNIVVQPDQSRTVILDVNELFADNKELAFSATGHSSSDCVSGIITVEDPPTMLSFDPNDDSAEQCEVRVRVNDGNRDDAIYDITIQYVSAVTVSLSTTANPITNLETIPFTATFSRDVTEFVQSDIAVAIDGTDTPNLISAFNGSGTDYTFTVTHGITAGGELTVTIPDGATAEGNTASVTAIFTVDRIDPSVSITPADGTTTGNDPVTFTATFSEDVQNFELDDITVTGTANGGSPVASNIGGTGSVYTFDVARGSTDGTIVVSIDTKVATDLAGNPNTASAPVTVTINTTVPSVSLDTTAADLTNSEAIEFTATFSEDVTGFVQSDIVVAVDGTPVTNSLITAFDEISGGTQYDFTVTHGIATGGELTVTIPDNVVEEGNTASTHTLTVDMVNPSVSITLADGTTTTIITTTNTGNDSVTFTATFSEDVEGFILDDITVTGTANGGIPEATNLLGEGSVYTFDVSRGSSDGTVTVSIDADTLTDLAGNPNTTSNELNIRIDTTQTNPDRPTATISDRSLTGGGGRGGGGGNSPDPRVCGLQLCSEINVGTGSASGQSISGNNTKNGTGQDLMDPEPQILGSEEDNIVPEPTAEIEMDPEPTAEIEMDPEPTAEIEMDPEPTAEIEMDPEPTAEIEMDPEPQTRMYEGTDPKSICGPGTQLIGEECVVADSQKSSENQKSFFDAIADFFGSIFGFV